MKKRYASLFTLSFLATVLIGSEALKAQSLEILDAPTQPVQGYYDDGNDLSVAFYVKNKSSKALTVHAFRKVIDTVQGSQNRFCWSPICWPPSEDTAGDVQSIPGNGGVDSTFKGYYTPNGNPGIAAVQYCFYDTSNTSDSVCTIIRYDATASVSIKEEESSDRIGLQTAPNPASDQLNVRFGERPQGTLRVMSILGTTVLERRLKGGKQKLHLNVSELKKGLHFLTFESRDGGSVTKKVMIRN